MVFVIFILWIAVYQAPVVQTLDSAIHRIEIYPGITQLVSLILIRWIVIYPVDSVIHRINHYPADEYYGKQLRSPLDSDLSGR